MLFTFESKSSVIFMNSLKQKCISCSSTESELIARFDALSHSIVYSFPTKIVRQIVIYQDNKAAMDMLRSSFLQTVRSRFMHLKFNYVKTFLESLKINVTYLPTNAMLAETFNGFPV